MSRISPLNPPFAGISSYVNVLGRVGPNEANNPDDVKIVQQLLQMICKGESTVYKSIGYPQITGHFDAATGFWIYDAQVTTKKRPELKLGATVVDGIVSPAHGSHYGPHGVWTIVFFNVWAQTADPDNYAKFLTSWGTSGAGVSAGGRH
ncbi:MAG TPA: hypothetical protein VH157_04920 [Bryobacteraceae bacterium]|jgi:hypothetical protein|nr:hypothetical protein [Bryobacteraceae bacterium]